MEISLVDDIEEGVDIGINLGKILDAFLIKGAKLTAVSEVGWTPPTDIYETENKLIVRMEIAGIDPAKLGIVFIKNTLIVEGKREDNDEFSKEHYYLMEIHFGFFRVVINIPVSVNENSAHAKYKGGFLYIIFSKKRDERYSRKIKIE